MIKYISLGKQLSIILDLGFQGHSLFSLSKLFFLIVCLWQTSASISALTNTIPIGNGMTYNFSQSTTNTPVNLQTNFDQTSLGGASAIQATAKFTLSMSFRINTAVVQSTKRGTLFTLLDTTGSACSQGNRIAALTLQLSSGIAQVVFEENLLSVQLLSTRQSQQLMNHWMFIMISYDVVASNCNIYLYKYATMDTYYNAISSFLPYSKGGGALTTSTVSLNLGSYFCTASNSETTFAGEIKNVYWTIGSVVSDFSPRHIFLLSYGGFTQVLNYFPVQEQEGDTIKDIIVGNDGNLGTIQNLIGYTNDANNPIRTSNANRKIPFLQYNSFITINFPYMGVVGVDFSKFFVAFWFYGVFAQTTSNPWILFNFNNTQLSYTSPTNMVLTCGAFVNTDTTTSPFLDNTWISLIAVFREQDDLFVNGYPVQTVEIFRSQNNPTLLISYIFSTYINMTQTTGYYIRPQGSIQFGGSPTPSSDSGFVIANIAIGKGSLIDDATKSIIIPQCLQAVIGPVKYCLKVDVNSAPPSLMMNGYLMLASACTTSPYLNTVDMCEQACSYRCSSCTTSTTCTACAGNRINPPLCNCPAYFMNLEGQVYCLNKDKPSDYAWSGRNDLSLQLVPVTLAFPQTPQQLGPRPASFYYSNYKSFAASPLINRVEIDSITRLDMVGQGFSLTKTFTSAQQIQENLVLYQNTVINSLQTNHFVVASAGAFQQVTYNLNSYMATVGGSDTLKTQTITVEPQTGRYPNILQIPRVLVFLLGFNYTTAAGNLHLVIRVVAQNISPAKCDIVITTNGLVGLQQITLSVGFIRPDHLNYAYTYLLNSIDQPLLQTKIFPAISYVATPFLIPPGTPKAYGIQGFDINLGAGGRITMDVQQNRYSTDRQTAYFDVSSWSDQTINALDIAAIWFVANCQYLGEANSNCKNSILYTDNSLTLPPSNVCSTGFYNQGAFPYCASCANGASSCTTAKTGLACPTNYRQDNVCYLCHYSCATCQYFDMTCLTCSDTSRTLTNVGQSTYCPCSAGYIDNGVAVCTTGTTIVCDITCLTCSGTATNQCLTCSSSQNRYLVSGNCYCNANYYEFGMRNCMLSSQRECSLQQTSNYFLASQSTIEAFSQTGFTQAGQSTQTYNGGYNGNNYINFITTNLNSGSGATYSPTNGQVTNTAWFSNKAGGDQLFTRVGNTKCFTLAYQVRREVTFIDFSHNLQSSNYAVPPIIYTRQTDKDIFTVVLFQTTGVSGGSGNAGGVTLYNFVFIPQTPLLITASQRQSGSYNKIEHLQGLNVNGIIYQLLFTELNGYTQSAASLSSVVDQMMTIINNARQSCIDPLPNFMLSMMDLNYDSVFAGINTNVQTGLINQINRTNDLAYSAPFIQINDIYTDRSALLSPTAPLSVTYSWGVDSHEYNLLLGPNAGAIATRNYDNMFFNVMRLDTVGYIQVSNTYSDTQPMEVLEYQLFSKVTDEVNFFGYAKQTRVFNSQAFPTLVTINVFRDNAFSSTGNIVYNSFSSNKRSQQVFSNIRGYYRAYQLIFFGSNGYFFSQAELQTVFTSLVVLITKATLFTCGQPNLGTMHNLVNNNLNGYTFNGIQSVNTNGGNGITFNGIQTIITNGQNECNSLQTSNPLIATLQVFSNGNSAPLPTPRANRLNELPSQLGRLGKQQQILDQVSILHLHYLLDQVSSMAFVMTLNAGTSWTLAKTADTITSGDGEVYYFYWFQYQYSSSFYQVDYFVLFSNQQLTYANTGSSGAYTLTVSSLTNIRELYFVSFGRYNGTITQAQMTQFENNYVNNIIYPAKHYMLHRCPSYNFQMVCGTCASPTYGDRNGQFCDQIAPDYLFGDNSTVLQTNNIFDDNINLNGMSSCYFFNNPLHDWTAFTSSYYTTNPVYSYDNIKTWASVGSTYLSNPATSCSICARISSNLAPGVYLPYTFSAFGSQTSITGSYTRYYTQHNPTNMIVALQLNGVSTLYVDTIMNTGPAASSGGTYQTGVVQAYDIYFYCFVRYSDGVNDDVVYYVIIPQHLGSTTVNVVTISALTSQLQINVQGISQVYIMFTTVNRAYYNNGFNFQTFVDMQYAFPVTILAMKPQSTAQCQCTLPNSLRDQNCMQTDGTTPSCYYQCAKCDIYAYSAQFCITCPATRVLTNNQCPCQNGYFNVKNIALCQACSTTCSSCTDYNQCTACASGNYRTLNTQTSFCTCNAGYYDTGASACAICTNPCVTCFASATQCTSCPATFQVSLLTNACVCADGYYASGSTCTACNIQCQICTGGAANNCQICATASFRTLNPTANTCPCSPGYYDVGTAVCSICTSPCLTCTSSATNCLSCVNGYYLNGATCSLCNYQCLTCNGASSTSCQTCATGVQRQFSVNACPCNSGYYDDGSHLMCATCVSPCVTCVSVTNCQSCIAGYYNAANACTICVYQCLTCNGPSSSYCLTCPTGALRTQSGNTCPCNSGYYDNGVQLCVACVSPCTVCLTVTNCQACISGYYNANNACTVCVYQCLTCNGPTQSNCQTCPTGSLRTQSGSSCPCNSGYYDNGNQVCVPCVSPCTVCQTVTNCQACINGYYNAANACTICSHQCLTCNGGLYNNCLNCPTAVQRTYGSSMCPCNSGYYDDGTSVYCAECVPPCVTCTSASVCQTCFNGYYSNSGTCTLCNYQCLTCNGGSSSNCLSCQTAAKRTYGSNLCPCNNGYYDDGSSGYCQVCVSPCVYCTSATTCTTCGNGNYLNAGTCSPCSYKCLTCSGSATSCLSCQTGVQRTQITSSCPCNSGYYDDGSSRQCATCVSPCVTCVSVTNCQSCINGYYDASSTTCTLCNYQCLTCNGGNSNNCQSCPSAVQRTYGSNMCPCNNGYYDDGSSVYCAVCVSPCVWCTSATTCTHCSDGNYLNAGTCSPCNYKCLTCSGTATSCLTCQSGVQRTQSGSLCPCNSGYYDDGSHTQCATCVSPCLTCISVTNCQSCINGYYDASSTTCTLCNYQCLTCNGGNSNNCQSCPPGVQRSQSGSSCPCNSGYYDDGSHTQCATCVSPCLTCISVTNCQSCINGYYDASSTTCTLCNYQCLTCNGGTANNCQSCTAGVQRTQITSSCPCNSGYYDDGSHTQCATCVSPCLTCISVTNCQSCINGYYDASSTTCTLCNYQCLTCNGGTANNCQTCLTGVHRTQSGSSCPCDSGYYDNGSSNYCLPCVSPCGTCTSSTFCLSCASNGFILTGSLCLPCHYSCLACSGQTATNCLSCTSTSMRTFQPLQYQCSCNNGYFDNNTQLCATCRAPCLTCTSLATYCLSCSSAFYLNAAQCLACDPSCLTCSGAGPNKCISCPLGIDNRLSLNLITNSCQCIFGYFESGTSVCAICSPPCLTCINSAINCTSCGIGFYLNATTCQPCSPQCATCNGGGANNCLTCADSLNSIFDVPTSSCSCKSGYFNTLFMKCSTCSAPCVTCTSNSTTCLSCLDGYYLNGQTCSLCNYQCLTCSGGGVNNCLTCSTVYDRNLNTFSQSCPCNSGYFDAGTQLCGTCSSPCSTCSVTSTNCTSCVSGFYLNGTSCAICNSYCQTCSGPAITDCQSCSTAQHREHDATNQCLCQSGYFDGKDPTCGVCQSPCLTCKFEAVNCLSCIRGAHLNVSRSGSHLYGSNCVYGQACETYPGLHTNRFGNCIARCGDGVIRYDRGEQCDDGNSLSSDGCSSKCQIEAGFSCSTQKSPQNSQNNYELTKFIYPSICVRVGVTATLKYVNDESEDQLTVVFSKQIMQKGFCSMVDLKIESLDSSEFSFTCVYLTQNSCSIQLTFYVSSMANFIIQLGYNGTSVPLTGNQMGTGFNYTTTASNNVTSDSTHISLKTRHFTFYTLAQRAQTDSVVKFQQSFNIALLVLGVLVFLVGGVGIYWSILEMMTWISTLYFINVAYPLNIQMFLKNSKWTDIFRLQNIIDLNLPTDVYYQRGPGKFHDKQMDGCYIASTEADIEFVVIGLFVYLFSNLMCIMLERIYYRSQSSKIGSLYGSNVISQQKNLELQLPGILKPFYKLFKLINDNSVGIAIKLFMLVYLDLHIGSILQLKAGSSGNNSFNAFNIVLAVAFQISGPVLATYLFTKINKSQVLLNDEDYSHKYSAIYEEILIDTAQGKIYCIVSLLKKTFYVFSLVLLYNNPILQTISCTLFYSINILLICFKKTFTSKLMLIKNLIPQLGIFGALATTIVFAIDDQSRTLSDNSRFLVGWVMFFFTLSSVTLQCITLVFKLVSKIAKRVSNMTSGLQSRSL